MKTKQILFTIILASLIILNFGCQKKEVELAENAMDDIEKISYTVLGRLEPINIVLKKDILHSKNIEKACVLNPSVKGEWKLLGKRQLIFTPSEAYDFKQALTLDLDVGLLLENTANKKTLNTTFTIAEPEFNVISGDLVPNKGDDSLFDFKAICESDVPIEIATVNKMLKAILTDDSNSRFLKVKAELASAKNKYKISIKNIKRKKEFQELLIKWDLGKLGVDKSGSKSFTVPPEAVFQITNIQQVDNTEICVNFSDAINKAQDLRGFIKVKSAKKVDFRCVVDNFKLKIFSKNGNWPDDTEVLILQGIKNTKGKVLQKQAKFSVTVAWEKPNIAFTKSGNIVPIKKNKTSVLVSTKNIKGLVFEAFQIYENNMLQHLQENDFSQTYQLRRVGEPVYRQKFEFEWNADMKNRWVTRELDITKLIKKFPGGMFDLRVSFLKEDSMYEDSISNEDFSNLPFPRYVSKVDLYIDVESDYWMHADISYAERNKFWRLHRNPMHPAYYLPSYNKNCFDSKKVLATNIGLSVKKDSDGKFYIAAADLNTAEAMSGVKIKLFSYAQKELLSAKTDSNGLLVIPRENTAFFIQAEKDGMYNWIVPSRKQLSTSHFEVEGVRTDKGVKGYLYAERDVWRPGDDIHLTFILQDLEKNLPKDIPVKFTLEDPLGKVTDTKVLTSSVDGFYRFDTKTNEKDKTGNWNAYISVGGRTWSKSLKVETIIPNRLFVKLKPKNKYLQAGTNSIDLSSEWLHGAKASGLKAEISARYILNRRPFKKYKDYNFINNEIKLKSGFKKVWTGNLDESGKANLSLGLSSGKNSPGKLTAIFETRIYEPSGAFSIENKSFDYSPYKKYVGMQKPKSDDEYRDMLYTKRDHNLNFVVLDNNEKLVKGNSKLVVKLYRLRWYWWWEVDDNSTNYTTARDTKLIKSWDLVAKNGKANLKFKLSDNDWGRYLITVQDKDGGHSSAQIVYFDWESWASRKTTSEDSSSMLMLTTDKNKYYTNETAQINFPSYKGAKALVTTEKNGKVLKQEWVTCKSDITSYKVKLDNKMAPNIYVHVSLIQEYQQTKNNLPIRMYGITPVMIENKNSRLLPQIKAAKVFEPNSKAVFTVSEKNGKPMTCTIAVVDEGLLGLTGFYTKDPWNQFYKKESSQIAAWDIYDYVVNAYSGEIASLLSVGGGGAILRKAQAGKKTGRFKPVVFYFGPYELKAREKKTVEFQMPQYSGAVRIMAVAGKDGAYGVCEEQVKVKSDLIVLPTLPRTIGNGEEIEIPVTAFNGTDKARTATVKLKVSGAITATAAKNVKIPANGDANTSFTVKANKLGTAKFSLELSAKGVSKTAKSTTEVQVLSRGTPYSDVESFGLSSGKDESKSIKLKGEPNARKLTVEISQMPALGLEQRLDYLLRYPYGCIEQISSKGFAQLYIPQILDLDADEIAKVKEHVNSVLERYQNYQVASGAFAYWPNGSSGHEWGTNYAGHFMVEAKKQGYNVNESVYQAWLANQKDSAKNWASSYTESIENQAYRLYTLALAGEPELGAMNRLKAKKLNDVSKSLLGAAYALAGHQKIAKEMIEKVTAPNTVYRYTGGNFYSNIRNTALLLNSYTTINEKAKSPKLIEKLAKIFSSDEWLSTQECGWVLLSLAPYYKFDKMKNVEYEIISDGKTIKDTLKSSARIYTIPVDGKNSKNIRIKNSGQAPFFVAITSAGQLKPGEEEELSSRLALTVSYYDESGKELSLDKLKKLGQRFKIKLSVKNKSSVNVENVVLSLPIPTGWEMTNLRLSGGSGNSNSAFNYQDIRDTHIYTHFNLKGLETKTVEFGGTVTYKGKYYIPAIHAEAMYDSSYKAVHVSEK